MRGASIWMIAIGAVMAAGSLAGCATPRRSAEVTSRRPATVATTRPTTAPARPQKPMIDFARGAGGLPLPTAQLPPDPVKLAVALRAMYGLRVDLPPGRPVVEVIGDPASYPALDSLRIDLSDGKINPDYKPTQFKSAAPATPALTVKHFEYLAQPLRYERSSSNLRITATDVQFGLLREKDQAALVVTDAADGRLDFDVSLADLSNSFRFTAKRAGGSGGFFVHDTSLSLASDNPHSLTGEVRVAGFWLLLPTTFRIAGRLDVDEKLNAHLSDVACYGEDLGGALAASFINPSLKKVNGQSMPFAAFPGSRARLHDVTFHVDDSLRVNATFGR